MGRQCWQRTLRRAGLPAALLLGAAGCAPGPAERLADSRWRAVVELPGGELPFEIAFEAGAPGGLTAELHNGAERVRVGRVAVDGERVLLEFPAFNNRIDAVLGEHGLEGTLTLVKRGGVQQVMPLRAQRGVGYRFFPPPSRPPALDVSGRWAATFEADDGARTPAVGEFIQTGDTVAGTFLTPTGDYRYLAGQVRDDTLHLSTFDGAHAFLFEAQMREDGALEGDFWSGTAWHERWTARRDPGAALPDAQSLTYLKDGYTRFDFTFPDVEGDPVSLDDPRFDGKVVLVMLAGSWCPNCHDEAAFMAPFHEAYREQGLEVVALMFEHFGDFETAAQRTRAFREKFGIEYVTLIAGTSDKDAASERLPMLNRVLAFPTTIFVDRRGQVRRIHTGFTGPGTGTYFEAWKADFTAFVETLLNEEA